jgi:hypothetical protein
MLESLKRSPAFLADFVSSFDSLDLRVLPVLFKELPVIYLIELEPPVFSKPLLYASVLRWPPPPLCNVNRDGA